MAAGGRRAADLRRWAGWQALCALVTGAFLVFVRLAAPGFFWVGDRQNQSLPVLRDIGRRLRSGEWLPLIDPDLAVSGNYAIDVQYGIYDPTHWLVALGLTLEPNAEAAAWWWSSAYLLLLAAGACALALRLGAPGGWSVATGFAAPTSGYTFLWLSTSWIAGLVGVTWLVWWWWALAARRPSVGSLVGLAAFAFLTATAGFPAVWVLALVLAVGFVAESWVRRDRAASRADYWVPLTCRVAASAAGAVAAVIGMLPYLQAAGFTKRKEEISNSGFLVPNLADLLAMTSPSLSGQVDTFGGEFLQAPVFFAVWFVPVVLWFVPWRLDVWRRPGLVAAATLALGSLLLTQAPSALGPLRWPIRFLPGFHLGVLVLGVVLLAYAPLRISARRCLGAAATLAFGAYLTWARQPKDDWLVGTLVVAGCAALVVLLLRRLPGAAGLAALAGSVLLAGFVVVHHPTPVLRWGYDPVVREAPLSDVPQPSVALYPKEPDYPRWFDQGVGVGFSRLTADERVGPGYSSVAQGTWRELMRVRSAHGYTGPESPDGLFTVEPRTDKPWIELMGLRSVVVYSGDSRLAEFRELAGRSWQPTRRTRAFVVLEPRGPVSARGRVTAVLGDAEIAPSSVRRQTQSYRVSTADGATLVFRDLFWPGYVATLDGESLEVEPLGDLLVTVRLPPGADGELELSYEPVSTPVLLALLGSAGLILLVAVLLALARARPRRGRGASEAATSL